MTTGKQEHTPAPLGRQYALLTDLYELTMAASYFEEGMQEEATFSLFIRKSPPDRGFFVAAGLAEAVSYLTSVSFSEEDLAYLKSTRHFNPAFLDYLKNLRFTGDVWALPEGSLFFKDEPLLEVSGPIIEAQLVESFLINAINLQTMIATKAARSTVAAGPRRLVDFSLRRTQGVDAGLKVARASYLAGFAGTSNVLAGKVYGLPIFGTMAHSYVTSFCSEIEAFRAYARTFPHNTVLLIDTYDTIAGAKKAIIVAQEMAARGEKLRGVRLDSGDMAALSIEVRRLLNEAGLDYVTIFASGGFDEFKIARTLEAGGEIDAYGVGTKMGVAADAPYFDIAYKLVKYGNKPVMKLSTGKVTYVDKKQVFRFFDDTGAMREDVIGLREEGIPKARPLLEPVMVQGRPLLPLPSLSAGRKYFLSELARLPMQYKDLKAPPTYPVRLSPGLQHLQEQTERRVREQELG
ncbi:MAG: nicotinate phosphoribosyltransferase [Deltaproteobacteria bacterium]|nr:nicotinate phosphoribosyltransferase [Deltaproteobacteria bacterium]